MTETYLELLEKYLIFNYFKGKHQLTVTFSIFHVTTEEKGCPGIHINTGALLVFTRVYGHGPQFTVTSE